MVDSTERCEMRRTSHFSRPTSSGYRNLVALISKGFLEGYYYKPRIDLDLLAQHNDGLIVLSGCMSGLCAAPLLRNDYEGSKRAARTYLEIFGDRFYIEIMRHGMPEEEAINSGLIKVARELNIPLVATNDSHYLQRDDAVAHDVLLCIGTGKQVADTNRLKFSTPEYYVKSASEMRELFADVPDACDNTIAIAKRIDIKIPEKVFHLPDYPVPPRTINLGRDAAVATSIAIADAVSGDLVPVERTPEEYLRELCDEGLRVRYGEERATNDAALRERLEYELSVINKMGYASYFLIVWDFIKYARDHDIPVGPGRGSAVGSVASYCLRHHESRSVEVQTDLRAVPESRSHLDAGYRHRFLRRPPRRSHPLCHGQIRRRTRRADRDLWNDGRACRGPRRGPRARRAAARRRPRRKADPLRSGRI